MPREPKLDVVCSGDSLAMGKAQGAAVKQQIHVGRQSLAKFEAFRLEKPWWCPFFLFRSLAERKATATVAPGIASSFPEMQARLEGIARGAGVSMGLLYLMNGFEPLMASVEGRTYIPPFPGGCSALAVSGKRSREGEPIIAHNFDYLPLIQPFYILRESRPAGGLRSLEFTMAPLAGTIDGVNETGLCITYNYAMTLDRPAPDSGLISMAIGEALGRCRTVGEAADSIASRPRWGGGMLMLADAQGDIAALELSSTRTSLRRPGDGDDLLFHTNCFFHEPMCQVQVPGEAVFTARVPRALRGRRVLQSADERRTRLARVLPSQPQFDAETLRQVMADHGVDGTPNENTVCTHGDYWSTTASLQLFPLSRRMRVSYGPTCQARYVDFHLG